MNETKSSDLAVDITEDDVKDVISNYRSYAKELEKSFDSLWRALVDKKSMIETCRESASLYRITTETILGNSNGPAEYDSADTVWYAEKKYIECVNDIRAAIEANLLLSNRNDRIWSCYNALPLKYKRVLGRLYEDRNNSIETWRAACEELAKEMGCSVSKIKSMQKTAVSLIIEDYKKRL